MIEYRIMSNSETTGMTDQLIFDAAEALLRESGDGFTMEQLVSQTNLSRATIYRRVGTKEALLKRLAEERGSEISAPSSRTRILRAVRAAVAQHGLVKTTMEDIAAAAGVGVATLYRQFGDKDRLLRAFVEEVSPRAIVHEMALHPTEDLRADLTAIADLLLPFLYANRDMVHLFLTANTAEQTYLQHVRSGPHRLQDRLTEYFALQIAAGRVRTFAQPQELALAFFGMLLSFTLIGPRYYERPLVDPQHVSRLIVQIFVDGLQP